VSSDARAAGGSDADAAAKPSDHEEGITLPNGSERIQASADSNPRGPAVHDGSVMWPGPTPKGVGARSAGPGAQGARIVTDPPSAKRNGGAGASVATGGPAGLARPGLPLRPAAKTNVGGEASDGEAEFETDGEAAPAQFDPTKTQAKWRNRSCRFRRPSTPMCGRREQGS
jgi:hypothetical protein